MKRQILIADGYNIIGNWPELNKLKQSDRFADARDSLLHTLAEYRKYREIEIILVFDAMYVPGIKQSYEQYNLEVVFTQEEQTADSYIEMESYKRRDEYRSIFVVTSDGAEQNQVLGNGAYRMAVSDLVRLWNEDKKVQTIFIRRNNMANPRSEIGRHIPSSVQDKLERLRRK